MQEKDCGCGCGGSNYASSEKSIMGWAPLESDIEYNPDISLTILAPSNWTYVGFDQNFELLVSGGSGPVGPTLTITCDCDNGGCDPFYAVFFGHKFYGCNMSNCKSTCGGTASILTPGSSNPVVISSGGYLDLSITPQILTLGDANLPGPFEAMFYSSDVMAVINGFLTSVFGSNPIQEPIQGMNAMIAPDGCKFVFVNICGRAIPLVVPISAIPAGSPSGSKCPCSCKKGTGCEQEKKGPGTHCRAGGCASCQLTIDSFDDEDMSILGSQPLNVTASVQCYQF